LGVGCAAFVAGGLLPPGDWGLWLALAAGLALVGLLVLLAFTGDWGPRPAAAAAVLLLLGLGGLWLVGAQRGLGELGRVAATLTVPGRDWLLLLGLLPVFALLSARTLEVKEELFLAPVLDALLLVLVGLGFAVAFTGVASSLSWYLAKWALV